MTLSHAVVAWVQASELSNTAALPRACAASSPCSEANAAAPTTPPSRTVLPVAAVAEALRSEEHTSELQSQSNLVCRLLLEKKKRTHTIQSNCDHSSDTS